MSHASTRSCGKKTMASAGLFGAWRTGTCARRWTCWRSKGGLKEIVDPSQRMRAIAEDFRKRPENTLVVSPDNASRHALNKMIRTNLQEDGWVERSGVQLRVLVPRQDLNRGGPAVGSPGMTSATRFVSAKGARTLASAPASTPHVLAKDGHANTLTVRTGSAKRNHI